jgi:intracellular septation protein
VTPSESSPLAARKASPVVRAVVDYGGLAAFMTAYFLRLRFVAGAGPIGWSLAVGGHGPRDLTAATAWLVIGSTTALATGLIAERRIALMPLITGGLALVFGGLTLAFHDPRFIKVKPTITNLLLGGGLLGGMILRKNPLKLMIGEALPLPDIAWRTLTLRYGLFFLAMAILNEIVWRTQADSIWVQFHTYGTMGLAVLFSLTQVPLMAKYIKDPAPPPPPTD